MVKLSDAPTLIASRLLPSSGVAVVVVRGADHCDIAEAIVGRTPPEIDASENVTQTWESRDFIVATDSYIFGGEVSTPQRGDIIQQLIGGTLFQYQVVPLPLLGGQCFDYCDVPKQMLIRIHTRLVE